MPTDTMAASPARPCVYPIRPLRAELREHLFGDAYPEAAEITMQGLRCVNVVFFDDQARDVQPRFPMVFETFKQGDQFVLYGAVKGDSWERSVRITLR